MTKVSAVEARVVRIPLHVTTSFARRTVGEREYCLVRVSGDEGVGGIGFCYGGHKGAALVRDAVTTLLRPLLLGDDAYRTAGLWQDMYQEVLLQGRAGSVMRALSIVDIALWDRNARAAGLPLWRYLGGVATESVDAYASGGYYRPGKGPDQLAEEVRGHVTAGFHAVKIKVGRMSASGDEERIAAAREAIGPDVLLMLDANNAWTDLVTAVRSVRRWERYDPYWIEEPFSPDDIDNHARMAQMTSVPVATGEIEAGRWRHKDLAERVPGVILQTDAAVCGGITEFRRIAGLAESFGLMMCPHWFHDLHVHLAGSTPNVRFVEYFADDRVLNFRRLVDRQVEVVDGRIMLPTEPGLGFGFDEDALERYADGPWQ